MTLTRVTALAAWLLTLNSALASQPAFDSAADSVYNTCWTNGSNGGFGWGGAWVINTSAGFGPGATIGDSTTNGNGDPEGDGDINSPRRAGGRAWGLGDGTAVRPFSAPLSLGQTFSIDFDDYGPLLNLNYESSVFLLAPGGLEAFGIEANRAPNYLVGLPNGDTIDTGVAETDQGIHLDFTQLSSGIRVSLTPYIAGATTTVTMVPYSGQIASFEFVSGLGPAPAPTFSTPYINNIAITPEPSSAVLVGLVIAGGLVRRRRG